MLKNVSLGIGIMLLILIFKCGKQLVIIIILESILVLLIGHKAVFCYKGIIYLVELCSVLGYSVIK